MIQADQTVEDTDTTSGDTTPDRVTADQGVDPSDQGADDVEADEAADESEVAEDVGREDGRGEGDSAGDAEDATDTSDREVNHYAMIAIHADPSAGVSRYWSSFEAMVASATTHGHDLTILMNSDWAAFLMPDGCPRSFERGSNLATVAGWINDGHQLGYHHHTCSHFNPDGFTDVPEMRRTCSEGSVTTSYEMVTALSECLVSSGGVDADAARVDIAAQGPNDPGGDADWTYRQYEWQRANVHATGEMEANPIPGNDYVFLTQPSCKEYGDGRNTFDVAEMGHAQLNIGNFVCSQKANNISTLESEIDTLLSARFDDIRGHVGVVYHAREYTDRSRANDRDGRTDCSPDEYDDDIAYLEAVFELFTDKGVEVRTARQILSAEISCP